MTLRTEIGIISVVGGLAVGVWATVPTPFEALPTEPTQRFSMADFNAFDRGFELDGRTCAVGIAREKMCFKSSPLEAQLAVGTSLPDHLPSMPAEMPVILRTNLKVDGLQTQRFGQSLILVDTASRQIIDRLILVDTLYTDQSREMDSDADI